MKTLLIGLTALVLAGAATSAGAVICARGVYHAGCAGPNGAVVAHRPVAAPVVVAHPAPVVVAHPSAVVVRPAVTCRWINGHKVCG